MHSKLRPGCFIDPVRFAWERQGMKHHDQILNEHVLRSISDDYENFERIVEDVRGWMKEKGIPSDRQRVLGALSDLIAEGYAQAFSFSESPQQEPKITAYSAERIDELWFYVTPK